MQRTALSATRAMGVLAYLTSHPRTSFTLSELSRALGISLASLSAVLASMEDLGFIARDTRRKTFGLGPALVPTGHAASLRYPEIDAALPEMRALAESANECILSVGVGTELLVLAVEGQPSFEERGTWVGQRVPMVPPYGQVWVAWAGEAAISAWMARGGIAPNSDDAKRLRDSLAWTRTRGVSIGQWSEGSRLVQTRISEMADSGGFDQKARDALAAAILAEMDSFLMSELDPSRIYNLENMVSPIFGPDGEMVMMMSLLGISGITGSDLLALRNRLLEAARRVTHRIHGAWPGFADVP